MKKTITEKVIEALRINNNNKEGMVLKEPG